MSQQIKSQAQEKQGKKKVKGLLGPCQPKKIFPYKAIDTFFFYIMG